LNEESSIEKALKMFQCYKLALIFEDMKWEPRLSEITRTYGFATVTLLKRCLRMIMKNARGKFF